MSIDLLVSRAFEAVALVATGLPAYRASRLSVADALRYTG